ncbi:carbon-nitrogen hydrolase family protein [Candidatus Bathyarchaeota archaeon]|jgi:predicted amidohydrolase|nr:carbon-nitrogen hydrolase family protein [Candidatus Bathyarchaeota archaeon]
MSDNESTFYGIIEALTDRAASNGAKFLCFPEHYLSQETEDSVLNILELMKKQARKHNITIITGGFYDRLSDGICVTAPVVNPQGQLIGRQEKIHLFGKEKDRAKPGSEYRIFNVGDVKFGVIICYDLVFPEVARILALKGADMIFVPSRIFETGIEPWHLYLSARCLENRVPLIGANIIWPPKYLGHSKIFDLQYDNQSDITFTRAVAVGGQSQEVLIADVNLKANAELRNKRFRERRPKTYDFLLKK